MGVAEDLPWILRLRPMGFAQDDTAFGRDGTGQGYSEGEASPFVISNYLMPKNTTMLKMRAKMLTRCMRHTILEFIRGLLGKRPSHFFW